MGSPDRDEYDVVSGHFKNMLVQEYVRKHPGVHPSQVIVKSENGKSVCDVISTALKRKELQKVRPAVSKDLSHGELRQQLETSEEDRYEAAMVSVRSSARLIEFLHASPRHPIGPMEKKQNMQFFKRCLSILSTRTETVTHIKQGFMQLMSGAQKVSPPRVKTMMLSYLEAIFEQLKAQGSIFKREHDLGNEFCGCVIDLINAGIPAVKAQLQRDDAVLIARAYKTMQVVLGTPPPDLTTREVGGLDTSLKALQSQLEERRVQFEATEQILKFLEELILVVRKQIAEETGQGAGYKQDAESKQGVETKNEDVKKGAGRGMVFTQKQGRGGKRER